MIKKVLLFPNTKKNVSEEDILKVESTLGSFGIKSHRFAPGAGTDGCEAVIALGGDGTMLKAAHIAIEAGIPLLGINFGTLGYMSGIESGETALLKALIEDINTEDRMLIDITVKHGEKIKATFTALNEAVISRFPQAGIARLELLCDGTTVCAYRADGVIIATPTGSSAYALSAGGPIIDTKLDAFCVCPVCPHTIGSRAMVFAPGSKLSIINLSADGENAVTADGQYITALGNGDTVGIERSKKTLRLIKIKKDAFYDVLYRKMK